MPPAASLIARNAGYPAARAGQRLERSCIPAPGAPCKLEHTLLTWRLHGLRGAYAVTGCISIDTTVSTEAAWNMAATIVASVRDVQRANADPSGKGARPCDTSADGSLGRAAGPSLYPCRSHSPMRRPFIWSSTTREVPRVRRSCASHRARMAFSAARCLGPCYMGRHLRSSTSRQGLAMLGEDHARARPAPRCSSRTSLDCSPARICATDRRLRHALCDEALAISTRTGERFYLSELHRIKGELHLALQVGRRRTAAGRE